MIAIKIVYVKCLLAGEFSLYIKYVANINLNENNLSFMFLVTYNRFENASFVDYISWMLEL